MPTWPTQLYVDKQQPAFSSVLVAWGIARLLHDLLGVLQHLLHHLDPVGTVVQERADRRVGLLGLDGGGRRRRGRGAAALVPQEHPAAARNPFPWISAKY